MSNHYEQKDYSVIASVSVKIDSNQQDHNHKRGFVLSEPQRKKLLEEYNNVEIHAAIIYHLIKDIEDIEKIIICTDVKPVEKVMVFLQALYPGMFGRLKSLNELRREAGEPNFKSAADALARNINKSYPKRKNKKKRKEYYDDGSVTIVNSYKSASYLELLENLRKIRNVDEVR